MQPTIEIEITNHPAGAENPVERFIKQCISEAQAENSICLWKKVNSPYPGFKLENHNGAATILTCDSKDEQHIQYSLHSVSADGDAAINSIEWLARENEEQSDLHTLYTLLQEKLIPNRESRSIQSAPASHITERLVSALTVDARNLKSVVWTPEKDTGQEYRTYYAVGTSPGSAISIIPNKITEDSTTFTFVYEVAGHEIMSTEETAPTRAHSALRDLYFAVAGKDVIEENFELDRVSRFIASLREKDFLDRMLNNDFEQQPILLVWDIFKECNMRAVSHAYARTMAKLPQNTRSMDENFESARKLISRMRTISRCPNGKRFNTNASKKSKNGNASYDASQLDAIANSECNLLQEFYCGLPAKCAINRTAHLLLVAMLN